MFQPFLSAIISHFIGISGGQDLESWLDLGYISFWFFET